MPEELIAHRPPRRTIRRLRLQTWYEGVLSNIYYKKLNNLMLQDCINMEKE